MLQEIENTKSHSWETVEENAQLRKQLEQSITQAKNAKEENTRLLAAMEGIRKEREEMSSKYSGKKTFNLYVLSLIC